MTIHLHQARRWSLPKDRNILSALQRRGIVLRPREHATVALRIHHHQTNVQRPEDSHLKLGIRALSRTSWSSSTEFGEFEMLLVSDLSLETDRATGSEGIDLRRECNSPRVSVCNWGIAGVVLLSDSCCTVRPTRDTVTEIRTSTEPLGVTLENHVTGARSSQRRHNNGEVEPSSHRRLQEQQMSWTVVSVANMNIVDLGSRRAPEFLLKCHSNASRPFFNLGSEGS